MATSDLEYQSDGQHRPSFRFRHTVCGSDMGRMELTSGQYAYVCEECDITLTLGLSASGEIERYEV